MSAQPGTVKVACGYTWDLCESAPRNLPHICVRIVTVAVVDREKVWKRAEECLRTHRHHRCVREGCGATK
jgi:hypothetical protein